jgi:hypothetical protein
MSPVAMTDEPGTAVFRYSSSQILSLREKNCSGITRTLKRFLFVHKLLRACQREHLTKSIPVRVTRRGKESERRRTKRRTRRRERILTQVKMVSEGRRQASRRIPSVVLSNVCSFSNKVDEGEQLVLNLKPDIAVFVETWLDERTPNSAIDIPGYVSLRRDRNSFGGGILCYFSNKYSVRVLDSPVDSLVLYESMILKCSLFMLMT